MSRLIVSLLLAALSINAAAQDPYPSGPVRMVVPIPPGGPLDTMGRLLAQKMSEHWGRPVVVENMPGASGSVGTYAVARAPADGYTLLFTVDIPFTMFPAVAKNVPYDPIKSFRPIARVAGVQNGLFVSAALRVASAQELVALAKKMPGKLTFSSAGVASPAHFGGELFKTIAGIDMLHVPYKGAAAAMTAVLSGEVSMFFCPTPQGLPHVRSGKVRVLGVTGPRPSPIYPGTDPLSLQYPGLVFSNWNALFAPANTPDATAQAIGAALKRAMSDQELRAKVATQMDHELFFDGPQQVIEAIQSDLQRWRQLARTANIQAD